MAFLTFNSIQGLFGYVCGSPSLLAPLRKYAEDCEAAALTKWNGLMDIQTLKSLYAKGVITLEDVVNEVCKRIEHPTADPAIWLLGGDSPFFGHAREIMNALSAGIIVHFPMDWRSQNDLQHLPFKW